MPRTQIIIEDHVVPQLLTSAIEAYEIQHKAHLNGKSQKGLETYGLLWGYSLPARGEDVPTRLVAVLATVETSALRHEEWVDPDTESLLMKRDFFREYWPQLELIGTFHSHPYDTLAKVNEAKGWRGSSIDTDGNGDFAHWPAIHEGVCSDMTKLAHLVIAVTALSRKGTAWPERLPGGESPTGYVLSAGARKLWIKGYCTTRIEEPLEDAGDDSDELDCESVHVTYEVEENIFLQIPSLQQRFADEYLRK
ncbi:MAG: hypothetical protein KJ989_03585 [Gammaproteobacteria bacterium]|nr:hypothetical protein [Gammaproteobacteria bacterium]MBU2154720.1 hypothetical protein [Gammaproteobacteria bacterium]MBU2257230.1 hypothetical protein [Gammaproteobacteria bacterium]MBU2293270.1 hypothetical protein [Gammaproteobacteria bacterium]